MQLLDEFGDVKKAIDGEQGCLAAMAKLRRENPHLKTIVSVGGGSGSAEFPTLAANPDARKTFGREARAFCARYEFDGIDSMYTRPQKSHSSLTYVTDQLTGSTQLRANRVKISSSCCGTLARRCLRHSISSHLPCLLENTA